MTSVPNLASQPFRNERLPATLFGIALGLLLALTARHAFALVWLPARSSALYSQVVSLQADADQLRDQARLLRGPKPDNATLAHWTLLKDLVDRRAFSWTRLLSGLEAVLPQGVRIMSIDPSVQKGDMRVELTAVCRTAQDSLALVRALEASEEFEDVYPVSDEGIEGGESRYTMRYRPLELPPFVTASPAATAEAPAPPAPKPDDASPAPEDDSGSGTVDP